MFACVVIEFGVLLTVSEVMASHMQQLYAHLEKRYENDLDWTLLPEKLRA